MAYFVPTSLVLAHCANYMHDNFREAYPTIEVAFSKAQEKLHDDVDVFAWIKASMTWEDFKNTACIASLKSGDRGLPMAAMEFVDQTQVVPDWASADADSMRIPLGLILCDMEVK